MTRAIERLQGAKDSVTYGVQDPASFTFTFTAGAANVAEVKIQAVDSNETSLSGVYTALVYLSDAATGLGLTATAASGTVQAKSASGADIGALTAKKAIYVQTLAGGSYTLEITDTAKTAFYVAVQGISNDSPLVVSRVMATGDYGS